MHEPHQRHDLRRRAVVPRRLRLQHDLPAALRCTRSLAMDVRVMRRHGCASAWRSSAPQRMAACRQIPCMSAYSTWLKKVSVGPMLYTVSTFWPARGPKAIRQAEPAHQRYIRTARQATKRQIYCLDRRGGERQVGFDQAGERLQVNFLLREQHRELAVRLGLDVDVDVEPPHFGVDGHGVLSRRDARANHARRASRARCTEQRPCCDPSLATVALLTAALPSLVGECLQ